LIPYFEKDKKTYEFEVSFEGMTTSLDSETEVIRAPKEQYDILKNNFDIKYLDDILQKNFH